MKIFILCSVLFLSSCLSALASGVEKRKEEIVKIPGTVFTPFTLGPWGTARLEALGPLNLEEDTDFMPLTPKSSIAVRPGHAPVEENDYLIPVTPEREPVLRRGVSPTMPEGEPKSQSGSFGRRFLQRWSRSTKALGSGGEKKGFFKKLWDKRKQRKQSEDTPQYKEGQKAAGIDEGIGELPKQIIKPIFYTAHDVKNMETLKFYPPAQQTSGASALEPGSDSDIGLTLPPRSQAGSQSGAGEKELRREPVRLPRGQAATAQGRRKNEPMPVSEQLKLPLPPYLQQRQTLVAASMESRV